MVKAVSRAAGRVNKPSGRASPPKNSALPAISAIRMKGSYFNTGEEMGRGHPPPVSSPIMVTCSSRPINGGGIALQPRFIAGPAIAAGRLEVVLPQCEPEPLGLYAVYAHRQLQTAKLRCFLDFIDGYFGSPPYWDAFE